MALARALAVNPIACCSTSRCRTSTPSFGWRCAREIRRICKTAGFTTIYVTHDQKEALSVADRIAVMKDGKLVASRHARGSVSPPALGVRRLVRGSDEFASCKILTREGDGAKVETSVGTLLAAGPVPEGREGLTVSIRPEQLRFAANGAGGAGVNRIAGRTVETTFLGEATEHVVEVNGTKLKVIRTPPVLDAPADCVLEVDAANVVLL